MDDPALVALAESPAALIAAFVLGTLWGSFANVCIYRWPAGLSVVAPGSRCGVCGKPVRWYDNVPILSWLWLRGRCRDCQTQFSARYMLVEALTGLLFAVTWWFAVDARATLEPLDLRLLRFAIGATFVFVMVVILFIDLDHMLILDRVTLPSMVLFYGLAQLLPERAWEDGVVGAAVGLALARVVADLFTLATGREGLGLGDGKLLAVVGALLGWKGPMVSLFLGAMLGVVVQVPMLLARRGPATAEPEAAAGGEAAAGDDGDGLPDRLPLRERGRTLWSLAVVGAALGAALAGVPPWACALPVIVLALADDYFALTDPAAREPEPGHAEGEGHAGHAHAHEADAPEPGLPVEAGAFPFGPFLALAALFWWYAEPYVMFGLRHS